MIHANQQAACACTNDATSVASMLFRVSMLYLQKSEPFVGFFVPHCTYWLQALVLPSFYIGQTRMAGSNHSLVWSCLVIFYRLEQEVGNVSVTKFRIYRRLRTFPSPFWELPLEKKNICRQLENRYAL